MSHCHMSQIASLSGTGEMKTSVDKKPEKPLHHCLQQNLGPTQHTVAHLSNRWQVNNEKERSIDTTTTQMTLKGIV